MSAPTGSIMPATATVVEPYTDDELHTIAREVAAKLVLKVVDTYTHLSHQDNQIQMLQTYWGPMCFYAVATPRKAEEFAGSRLFGEALQMVPKARLFSMSVMVPPGALPDHFRQVDMVLTRAAQIRGANATLKRTVQESDPTGRLIPPAEVQGRLYTGEATRNIVMVTLSWDAGSDGEEEK